MTTLLTKLFRQKNKSQLKLREPHNMRVFYVRTQMEKWVNDALMKAKLNTREQ